MHVSNYFDVINIIILFPNNNQTNFISKNKIVIWLMSETINKAMSIIVYI